MDELDTTLMTRMLFIDALMGVGVPYKVTDLAVKEGLASFTGNQWNESWAWNKRILETLPTEELQDLYTQVKLQEVNHAC